MHRVFAFVHRVLNAKEVSGFNGMLTELAIFRVIRRVLNGASKQAGAICYVHEIFATRKSFVVRLRATCGLSIGCAGFFFVETQLVERRLTWK